MRVLAVSMSPRPDGNTEFLLSRVMDGIAEAGGETEKIRTHDLNVAPCNGCGGCARTGECVIADSFRDVAEKFAHCDGMIFASPLYFMNAPARGKALIDRLQSFWNAKHMLDIDRFGPRERPGLLISCAGHAFGPGGTDVFRGLEDTMTYAFDALGLMKWGSLLVRRIDVSGDAARDERLSDRAYLLGADFALQGFRFSTAAE
jgi:multimeric flavodoxin WrbA